MSMRKLSILLNNNSSNNCTANSNGMSQNNNYVVFFTETSLEWLLYHKRTQGQTEFGILMILYELNV